jgi:hypothetical protein
VGIVGEGTHAPPATLPKRLPPTESVGHSGQKGRRERHPQCDPDNPNRIRRVHGLLPVMDNVVKLLMSNGANILHR